MVVVEVPKWSMSYLTATFWKSIVTLGFCKAFLCAYSGAEWRFFLSLPGQKKNVFIVLYCRTWCSSSAPTWAPFALSALFPGDEQLTPHQCASLPTGLNIFLACESWKISTGCEQPQTQASHIHSECTSNENVGGTNSIMSMEMPWGKPRDAFSSTHLFDFYPLIWLYFNLLALAFFSLNMRVRCIALKEIFDSLHSQWGDVCFSPASLLWSLEIFSCGGSLWRFQVWI